ncbi:MAG: M67 family metallopeptidase [Actinomycetota bacterium]|nr:M67 family metallopeptidase [Actinomycetota bacterium]
MIELPQDLLREIVSHARERAPEEVCGWLAGKENRVLRVYPVPNAAGEPGSRFRMEPEAQLAAMREIRAQGLDLTGTYHSHPASPPYPSAKDQELALYPRCAHLIVSLTSPEPDIRCWSITRGRPVLMELIIDQ